MTEHDDHDDLTARLRAEIPDDLARAGLFEEVAAGVRRRGARRRAAGAVTGVLAVAATVAVYSGTASGTGHVSATGPAVSPTTVPAPGPSVHPGPPSLLCPSAPQPDGDPGGRASAPDTHPTGVPTGGLAESMDPTPARLLTGAPTAITVCHYAAEPDGPGWQVRQTGLTDPQLAVIVTALDRADVIAKDLVCPAVKLSPHQTLIAHYAGKPDQLLDIDLSGCGSISNGTFTALLPAAVKAVVR